MTATTTAKRQKFGGYGITEMRRYAREYGIKGRSTMDGHQLLAALRTYWHDTRVTAEQAVIAAATPGAILRHKSAGYTVRVMSAPEASQLPAHDGAMIFRAEYVTHPGHWANDHDGTAHARYLNEEQARRVENGSAPDRHMLWQYEAV